MHRALSAVGRSLMSTESEWNPKVILGRVITAALPEPALHRLKKTYYAYLLSHIPTHWQDRDTLVVRHLVSGGDCVLDIGASIGEYTKFLSSLVGPSGRVFSFEPNPAVYDYLSHNVRKLKLDNVRLFETALSDREGVASMVIPQYRWGSECHYDATLEAGRAASGCRQRDVKVCTLDSLFTDRAEKIVFVKCDVNYHELACLRGGRQTLSRFKPAILIEILPNPDKPGGPAAQVFELLQNSGYEPYWFDGRQLRKRQPGERSQNYFFLASNHVAQLPSGLLF